MRQSHLLASLATVLVIAIGFSIVWVKAREQHYLGSDLSPDGHYRADYTYSSRGIMDWVIFRSSLNPKMYLTITDTRTGQVTLREEYLADVAELSEARERFADKILWLAADDPDERRRLIWKFRYGESEN